MFEVLVALRRECSGNWTIQLVRLVLRSKKQHKFHHLYVPYSKQQFHWLVNGLKFVGLLAWAQKSILFGSRQLIAGVAKTGS